MSAALSARLSARTHRAVTRLLVALLLALAAAGAARAQQPPAEESPASEAPDELSTQDLEKPMGPADPYNRGTPRGSVYGFIAAGRAGDWQRAAEFLDLRRLPPREQRRGPELARELKTVLDRELWVDFRTLSDQEDGFADDGLPAWQNRLGEIETREGPVTLLLQRVPRASDGVRIWKVSADTVDRIASLYEEFGPVWLEDWLPEVLFRVEILGLALWQWSGLVVLALTGWLVALLLAGTSVRVLAALLTAAGRNLDRRIVLVVRGPVRLALAVLVFTVGQGYLALPVPTQELLRLLERMLWVVVFAWLLFRLVDVLVVGLRLEAEHRDNQALLPLLPPLKRFARVVIVGFGLLGVLAALGVNITAALAGLGVGGIAVALAAQKSLENLFGGISLFADRPVQVGDFLRYGDQVGTVEEIGLRSTRVRTLDRTVVSIPNAAFSNLQLENFAVRDRLRLFTMIGVRYETTPDQLRFLLVRLREVLLGHPRVTADPARVRFVGFGACSLDLEVFAYVDTSDWNEFLGIREEIYLLFMQAVEDAGTGFAFPSTTMYLGRDTGLDEESSRHAEQRVAEWRERGELPFPNHTEAARERVWNKLDWPPAGSSGPSAAP